MSARKLKNRGGAPASGDAASAKGRQEQAACAEGRAATETSFPPASFEGAAGRNPFSLYHPAVAFAYLACAIVFAMAAMHPVYAAMAFAGALACSCVTRGLRPSARSLAWAVPMALIVALANALFSMTGSTELARFSLDIVPGFEISRVIYLESLAYGLCAGGMLASVLLWFSSYAACMTSENTTTLFGNAAPVVSLLVSQVMRLIPQFLKRGRAIAHVQDAASAAAARTKKESASGRLRIVSVLMGWGMEDGLARSDAMRARGYGCGARRTTYRRHRIRRDDAAVLAAIGVLAAANAALIAVACSQYRFYPEMSALVLWWGYGAYAALLALPALLYLKEWWQWRTWS